MNRIWSVRDRGPADSLTISEWTHRQSGLPFTKTEKTVGRGYLWGNLGAFALGILHTRSVLNPNCKDGGLLEESGVQGGIIIRLEKAFESIGLKWDNLERDWRLKEKKCFKKKNTKPFQMLLTGQIRWELSIAVMGDLGKSSFGGLVGLKPFFSMLKRKCDK